MADFKYKFSGHQTFVFRYGWLEKGVQLIQKNPHGFNDDDCLITLGVDKVQKAALLELEEVQ